MQSRKIYYAHGTDATDNEFIGSADLTATRRDVMRMAVDLGYTTQDATDTCDSSGSVTDDDTARVWIVTP